MPKNPCNSTGFYFNTHDCILQPECLSAKGWPAKLRTVRSLPSEADSLFQHVCLPYANKFISNGRNLKGV